MRELIYRVTNNALTELRILRSRYLGGAARACLRVGITADIITGLSFLSGLAAVWFLFVDIPLFFLFGVLHLLFDAFDGVIARTAKATRYGAYIDSLNDQLIAVLLLGKMTFASLNVVLLTLTVFYAFEIMLYFVSRF